MLEIVAVYLTYRAIFFQSDIISESSHSSIQSVNKKTHNVELQYGKYSSNTLKPVRPSSEKRNYEIQKRNTKYTQVYAA